MRDFYFSLSSRFVTRVERDVASSCAAPTETQDFLKREERVKTRSHTERGALIFLSSTQTFFFATFSPFFPRLALPCSLQPFFWRWTDDKQQIVRPPVFFCIQKKLTPPRAVLNLPPCPIFSLNVHSPTKQSALPSFLFSVVNTQYTVANAFFCFVVTLASRKTVAALL
jgi:hypothetical protein